MQYIVIDLEWNQPLNHQNRVYREVGDRLIFEMIQIGAARMDADRNIVETISVPIRPTCYLRIHPRIERMTHLSSDVLADAPQFREAMEQFVRWCGEDYVLLTWGCDDVSVLQQNLDFFDFHPELPPLCDIQHQFSDERKLANRMGLQGAMELLGIGQEEERYFHNAENDAYYTAKVFQRFEKPEDVFRYPQKPKPLIRPGHDEPLRGRSETFASLAEALQSDLALHPKCPVCGRPTEVEEQGYVPQAADKYIGLSRCRQHGVMLSRLRFRVQPDGKRLMAVSAVKATRPNIAYIHTKQLQVAQRAAAGRMPDPESALLNADRSSVPFED